MMDLQGVELRVGDRVVYAASGYNHAVSLRIGEVVEITENERTLKVKQEDSGRTVRINLRGERGATKVMVL